MLTVSVILRCFVVMCILISLLFVMLRLADVGCFVGGAVESVDWDCCLILMIIDKGGGNIGGGILVCEEDLVCDTDWKYRS